MGRTDHTAEQIIGKLREAEVDVRAWLEKVGVKTLFIEPGGPWENGIIESFKESLGRSC